VAWGALDVVSGRESHSLDELVPLPQLAVSCPDRRRAALRGEVRELCSLARKNVAIERNDSRSRDSLPVAPPRGVGSRFVCVAPAPSPLPSFHVTLLPGEPLRVPRTLKDPDKAARFGPASGSLAELAKLGPNGHLRSQWGSRTEDERVEMEA
jgi:hypothetical protein